MLLAWSRVSATPVRRIALEGALAAHEGWWFAGPAPIFTGALGGMLTISGRTDAEHELCQAYV